MFDRHKQNCRTLSEIFNDRAKELGNKDAVYYYETVWSWSEYQDKVRRVAKGLHELGVSPGDRIAVMLQNIPASLVAQLAIWWLGATVVPLNVMFKESELLFHLTDSGAKGIFVLRSLSERIERIRDQVSHLEFVVCVNDEQDFSGKRPDFIPPDYPVPEQFIPYSELLSQSPLDLPPATYQTNPIAYLTYTSGTTGNPKGAVNTHENILNSASIYAHMAQINESDINIAFAPLFHITGSVAGLAVHLYCKCPLILLYRFDPSVALDAIERRGATFTVGAITTYLALMGVQDLSSRNLSSFQKAYSGGAPVSPGVVERFESLTGCYIHNVYGLTESANGIIMTPFGQRAPVEPKFGTLSVGKVGRGCEAAIVDMEDPSRFVDRGEVGELALRGSSITPGYWNREDATKQAFHQEWFLTGDVAIMDEEGWIYIVDRKKDMIVSSGNKIWPREVEDVFYLHPNVREVAVVGVPDSYRGERVKAYVALKEQDRTTEKELIEFVRERIAAYKVPREIEFVDDIPKTATGKFLRRALR